MDTIQSWAVTICVFSVLVLLFRMLFPSGNVKKAGETVISLLMVFMLISPFADLLSSGELTFPQIREEDIYDVGQEQVYAHTLEMTISEQLSASGIEVEELTLQTELDEENYLVLSSVRLVTASEKSDDEICACLEEALGIPAEIITIER